MNWKHAGPLLSRFCHDPTTFDELDFWGQNSNLLHIPLARRHFAQLSLEATSKVTHRAFLSRNIETMGNHHRPWGSTLITFIPTCGLMGTTTALATVCHCKVPLTVMRVDEDDRAVCRLGSVCFWTQKFDYVYGRCGTRKVIRYCPHVWRHDRCSLLAAWFASVADIIRMGWNRNDGALPPVSIYLHWNGSWRHSFGSVTTCTQQWGANWMYYTLDGSPRVRSFLLLFMDNGEFDTSVANLTQFAFHQIFDTYSRHAGINGKENGRTRNKTILPSNCYSTYETDSFF